jgi:hypothetical protein
VKAALTRWTCDGCGRLIDGSTSFLPIGWLEMGILARDSEGSLRWLAHACGAECIGLAVAHVREVAEAERYS